jgi:ribonuclease P protein component
LKAQGFPKRERIVSQKLIDELFISGQSHSLAAFPLRAVYLPLTSPLVEETSSLPSLQLLISVPKRRFKHAVDRNRVKRQVREAFRKNKHLLTEHIPEGQRVALAFIWLSDQHQPTALVEQRVIGLLQQIAKKMNVSH